MRMNLDKFFCPKKKLFVRPLASVVLGGRDVERGRKAAEEVGAEFLRMDFKKDDELREALRGFDAVMHAAGPFYGQRPVVLRACIDLEVKVYVDLSDPVEFLEEALGLEARKTTALVCGGAFPGMSNVLAVEAASRLDNVKDLNFSYFTSGLGGSGNLNLEITNFGFGALTRRFRDGHRVEEEAFAGKDLGTVDFKGKLGERAIWAWPFPEQWTVAEELGISGTSVAAMGTAPDIWNYLLRFLVAIVPRHWWSLPSFSKGMALFSQPLVAIADSFIPETHAMRIDVKSDTNDHVTVLQGHTSFRQCVGQSAAEFCLDLFDHPKPGIYLPEQRYQDHQARHRIIQRLTSTPGTTLFDIHKIDNTFRK